MGRLLNFFKGLFLLIRKYTIKMKKEKEERTHEYNLLTMNISNSELQKRIIMDHLHLKNIENKSAEFYVSKRANATQILQRQLINNKNLLYGHNYKTSTVVNFILKEVQLDKEKSLII